jgi:hypothetical protein
MKTQEFLNLTKEFGKELKHMCQESGKATTVPLSRSLKTPFRKPEVAPAGMIGRLPLSDLTQLYYDTDDDVPPSLIIKTWDDATEDLAHRGAARGTLIERFSPLFPEFPFQGTASDCMTQYLCAASWKVGNLEWIENGVLLHIPGGIELGFDHRSIRRFAERKAWLGGEGSQRPALRRRYGVLVYASTRISSLYSHLVLSFPRSSEALFHLFCAVISAGEDAQKALIEGNFSTWVVDRTPYERTIWDIARDIVLKARKRTPVNELYDLLGHRFSKEVLFRALGPCPEEGAPIPGYTNKTRSRHLAWIEEQNVKDLKRLKPVAGLPSDNEMLTLQQLIR